MNQILITSALPYANGNIHLGHLAGAYLPADVFARYSRLSGRKVLYVCGSDEHGVAITISAEKENTTPKKIIDKYHFANYEAFQKFGMSFDIYSRTSIEEHHQIALEFFADFLKKGHLIEKEEEQFFDPKANMFLPDRYVEGICPNCSSDKARGDQCDSCGAYYNQIELKNPKSIITGETPEVRKTTHWYFKFQDFQQFLENYIQSHSQDWKDNVLQQSRSWLKLGLTERAITRDLTWGVKLESIDDIPKEKSSGKVLYVWFDAVLGYISATKVWAKNNLNNEDLYANWWKNPETEYYAFIGKDNIVFHTLIFPAMLHARHDGYILPKNVPANEFLNLEGQKFSKSRNWSIDLQDFLVDFPEPHLVDVLRYSLLMNLPEHRDTDFTWKDFQTKNNSELAAIFGNFLNRTSQFLAKNFDSLNPTINPEYLSEWKQAIEYLNENYSNNIEGSSLNGFNKKLLNENDLQLIFSVWYGIEKSKFFLSKFRLKEAFLEIMNIARAANKYFNDEAPWKAIKENKELASKTLNFCVQVAYTLSITLAPVIPYSCAKLQESLGVGVETGNSNNSIPTNNLWDKSKLPCIENGTKFQLKHVLFPIIEDKTIEQQISKLVRPNDKNHNVIDIANLITIDDFRKVQLKSAKVLEAERVAKAEKLLKLQIQIGEEKRQLVAGIAKYYEPSEIIGKTIVVVANLQPAKLFGIESQGMLLAAKTTDGQLSLLTTMNPDFSSGAEVS